MSYDELKEAILADCAEMANVPLETIEEDFNNFNAEIDRLIKEGLSEDEALIKIWDYWIIPNVDVCED